MKTPMMNFISWLNRTTGFDPGLPKVNYYLKQERKCIERAFLDGMNEERTVVQHVGTRPKQYFDRVYFKTI